MNGNDALELIERADDSVEVWYTEQSGVYLNPDDGQREWESLEEYQRDAVTDSYAQYLLQE